MKSVNLLTIRTFEPGDQAGACQLILDGLQERWGTLDPAKNPDLDNIGTSYQQGAFLVGVLGEEIVATGALIPESELVCRVVRMSTRKDLRNQGIGSKILKQLIDAARSAGYETLVLETTASWEDAVQFYQGRGFQSLGVIEGDHHFTKQLED